MIVEIINKIELIIWGTPLVALLFFTHIFFTIKLKFPQKGILLGIRNLFRKKINNKNNITPFASLMAVLASTIGAGNIVGVATAISIGGPGSIFWMFISGIFAYATKYAETYINMNYRYKQNNKYIGRQHVCY